MLRHGLEKFRWRALTTCAAVLVAGVALGVASSPADARKRSSYVPKLPEIRMHARNRVPACVTPARLMRFLQRRNKRLYRPYRHIAYYYRLHGEQNRVRWDYAFFQMVIETNYLTYKTGKGRWGDVSLKQNNFAGIGTTGGGVPGDHFPDVSTGVLGQIQHLMAYSGERLANPVAPRTRLKQGDIISLSRKLKRPVTFTDLRKRWAVDPAYAKSIKWVADSFYKSKFCKGRPSASEVAYVPEEVRRAARRHYPRRFASRKVRTPKPKRFIRKAKVAQPVPQQQVAALRPSLAPGTDVVLGTPPPVPPGASCRVWSASYGGRNSLLIRSIASGSIHYTALQVQDGFQKMMAKSYIRSYAKGGVTIAEFKSKKGALAKAFALCPPDKR